MPLSPMKKRLMILVAGNLLAACTPTQGPVFCHHWNAAETAQVKAALATPAHGGQLPADSPIHPVIRDYERVCGALNK